MAFRTTVGEDYQTKNRFDAFLESQEEAARGQTRITNSLAHNAVQAGAMVTFAVAPLAQKNALACHLLMRNTWYVFRCFSFQASDAVARGMHKGWIMAQKGAWAVKQMQLEADLAASGMQQGMQVRIYEAMTTYAHIHLH